MSLPKPAIGQPCNGCGLCCQIEVCGTGSFVLGLVKTYGERAPGPCPILKPDGDGFACGLMARPRDYLAAGAVQDLRRAVGVLIGAGAGCDEAGDEPDKTAQPQIAAVTAAHVDRHGVAAINAAVEQVMLNRKKR